MAEVGGQNERPLFSDFRLPPSANPSRWRAYVLRLILQPAPFSEP